MLDPDSPLAPTQLAAWDAVPAEALSLTSNGSMPEEQGML